MSPNAQSGGRIVIAAYRPKDGKHDALRGLVAEHVPILRQLGLASERAPIIMEAEDGTVVEVFEWRSKAAIDEAHRHPTVLKMWEQFGEICDYVPITDVPEAAQMFPEFIPLSVA